MADDKTRRGEADRRRVAGASQRHEVDYLNNDTQPYAG